MSEERVSRSAGFAFLADVTGAVLTAGLTIFLGRALAAGEYGSFAFAMSVVMVATLFSDLGITASAARFMAERRGDPEAAADVFRTAARMKLRAGLLASVVLFALAGPICEAFGATAAVWPLRVLAVSLVAQSMFQLPITAFNTLGKIRYNVIITTVESVVEVVASISLVALGAAATGAAFGNAIGYTAGATAGLIAAHRKIGNLRSRAHPRTARSSAPTVPPRQILSYAGPLTLVEVAFRMFANVDVLLIAALVGSGAQVAAFVLPMRLAGFLSYPERAVAAAVAPRLARWRGGEGELELFARSLRYLIVLQMAFTAPLVIWPDAIIHLIFGDRYPEAPDVLRALAPYVFLSGIAQITTLAVNYLGEARRRVPLAFAMLAVNVVIDVLLLPRIGIVAAAIGTSAAYALWVPAHLWILRKRVGLKLRPLVLTAARVCLAGAAMVGSLAALGTGVVPPALMAAGLLLGGAVYLAVLFAVHELTLRDIAYLRGAVRSQPTARPQSSLR